MTNPVTTQPVLSSKGSLIISDDPLPDCAQSKWDRLFNEGIKAIQRRHYGIASRFFTGAYQVALHLMECNVVPANTETDRTSLDCLVSAGEQLSHCLQQSGQTQKAQQYMSELRKLLLDICSNRHTPDWEYAQARDYLSAL